MKQVVFISGNFDVVHIGHLRLFKHAKKLAVKLVVGLWDDSRPEFAPREPYALRLEALLSVKYIDEVIKLNQPLESTLARIRPDIVLKGAEFEDRDNSEEVVLKTYGGVLKFGSDESLSFSEKDSSVNHKKTYRSYFENLSPKFVERHQISKGRLRKILSAISGCRVTIVGDSIVDEYIDCEPLGMSQEDPTIVVKPLESRKFIGGASIVAAHASGMGAFVDFHSVIGIDDVAEFLRKKLAEYGVNHHLVEDCDRPTTLKTRYRANGKTLLRVSSLSQSELGPKVSRQLRDEVKHSIESSDFLVFSDFSYGCLSNSLISDFSNYAEQLDVSVSGDSQSSSQIGDILRFKKLTLLSATEREARIALRDYKDGIAIIGNRLKEIGLAENVFLKLGEDGLIIFGGEDGATQTDRIPALNTAPRDSAGAGDSMLISASLALAVGANIWEAGVLGSLAAAIQVSRIGNEPIQRADLRSLIDKADIPE